MTEGERFGPPAPFEPPAWVAERLGRPTGKGVRVAVIDSGWDRNCDDPRVLPGIGLVDPADELAMLRTDDDHDRVGHGTACIHQILRIAPDATVIPIRVFGRMLDTGPLTLITALEYAMEQGVDVVNLSLGTTLEWPRDKLYYTCEMARRQGIIVVTAGHNSRDWSYPAIFENVIGVSAARFGSAYDYHYLPDEATECQAWGVGQPVVWLGGKEEVKHGTSFAAPNITGIVCLLLERHPGATLEDVRKLLRSHAIAVIAPAEPAGEAPKPRPRRPRAKAAAAAKKPSQGKQDAAETPPSTAPRRRRQRATAEAVPEAPAESSRPRRKRAQDETTAGAKRGATAAKKASGDRTGVAEKPAPRSRRQTSAAVAENVAEAPATTPEPRSSRAKAASTVDRKRGAAVAQTSSRRKMDAEEKTPAKAPRRQRTKG